MASVGRASAMLASGTMVSRVLGFVRSLVLVQAVGAVAAGANAYSTATQVPNSIYAIIAQGILSAVLVPQIVRASVHADGGKAYINKLVTLGILIFVAVTVVATLLAPFLSLLFGARGEFAALVTAFAYWSLPQIFFLGLYSLLGEVLNARKSFGPFTWAPVFNNIVSIAMLVVFIVAFGSDAGSHRKLHAWTPEMIALLGGGATLGIAVQALVLFFFWRRVGLSFRFDFKWRGVNLGAAGKAAGWTFAMLIGTQIAGVIETNVANTVATQGVASVLAMATAWLVFMLPHSIIAVSIVTAFYTRMAEHAREGDISSFRIDFSTAARSISALICFFSVALIVAAYPIARVFTPDYSQVGNVLIGYAVGLVPFCILFVIQRAFYSLGDTRTPFFFTLVQVFVAIAGVLLCLLVIPEYRAMAIAFAVSIAGTVQAVVAAILLRRRVRGIDGRRIVRGLWRFLVAAVIAGAIGMPVLWLVGAFDDGFAVAGRIPAILSIAAVGVVMFAVYAGMLRLLRTEEFGAAWAMVQGRLPRRRGRSGSGGPSSRGGASGGAE
ncbi:murein biosynthesis integral membrane protein MurJ [Rathayibacter sp. CAU 1779]